LKQAHDASMQIDAPGDERADTAETARRDLDRIFNTGGVAALVCNTYGAPESRRLLDIAARRQDLTRPNAVERVTDENRASVTSLEDENREALVGRFLRCKEKGRP
jgi:hypothetical protein